jgi:hypothetical protein
MSKDQVIVEDVRGSSPPEDHADPLDGPGADGAGT